MAALDVSSPAEERCGIASDREQCRPTNTAIMRGTVFHASCRVASSELV